MHLRFLANDFQTLKKPYSNRIFAKNRYFTGLSYYTEDTKRYGADLDRYIFRLF